ncbi:site-specific integrase [Haloechinothrix sp. YIM 98757]|uniref:Site-specific integrase n=1 Tax=Haloechinothrix aidingensis TaxID=2752311 RepID=A0A838A9N3_9PSEU|nr:site-specific integrase [Haloechinothrix aidingensis]
MTQKPDEPTSDDGGAASPGTGAAETRDRAAIEPQERLARLDAVAEAYVREQRPANTRRAYAEAWKVWEDYTRDAGIPMLSGTVGALVGFVRWMETTRQAAVATVDARLAGAVAGLRQSGVSVDRNATRAAWQALKGYERRLAEEGAARGRGKAQPITLAQLRALVRACPETNAGLRDRALLLIGFTIAARRSELAGLRAEQLTIDGTHGLVAALGYTKTGPDERPIPHGTHRETCPVLAWQAWTEAADITEGPAFRRIDRHDHVFGSGLSAQAVGEIITRCGKRAELPFRITGHSLRAGLATEARRNGADHKAVCDQGGWVYGSKAVHGYFHTVDRWNDNPVRGIGL